MGIITGKIDEKRFFVVVVFRDRVSVALEPVLELALVDHFGLELTEICLLLPHKCWD